MMSWCTSIVWECFLLKEPLYQLVRSDALNCLRRGATHPIPQKLGSCWSTSIVLVGMMSKMAWAAACFLFPRHLLINLLACIRASALWLSIISSHDTWGVILQLCFDPTGLIGDDRWQLHPQTNWGCVCGVFVVRMWLTASTILASASLRLATLTAPLLEGELSVIRDRKIFIVTSAICGRRRIKGRGCYDLCC